MTDDTIVGHHLFDAGHERAVMHAEEAQRLQDAVFNALAAYVDYLDRHGLIWDTPPDDLPTPKARRLVASVDFCDADDAVAPIYEIGLEGGPLDRRR